MSELTDAEKALLHVRRGEVVRDLDAARAALKDGVRHYDDERAFTVAQEIVRLEAEQTRLG